MIDTSNIIETIDMINNENLDIRTVTMGISLLDCIHPNIDTACDKIYNKICKKAENLVDVCNSISNKYGIPIVNKRIAVTPISMISSCTKQNPIKFAYILEKAAKTCGIDFIGGYSALVQKGFSCGDLELMESIPYALSETNCVCSSVNIGSTKSGINMDAVALMGKIVKKTAKMTADENCIGAVKLVVFCNAPSDNPFMAGAFHGPGEPDCVINVGVSGPGVVYSAIKKCPNSNLTEISETIKKTAFKITRTGMLVGTEAARKLNIPFGIVDLSLAPTPTIGDSVAHILEEIGLEKCGCPGTTATLAMLNDAVKKGGVMASSKVGGLSGAFIPVTEDSGMVDAARCGALKIEKLEAMTAVCSVGLDMIVIPGDCSEETIAAIIADEAAIGMVNSKTTAVRIIPAINKSIGQELEFGGLLGSGPIMDVCKASPKKFILRGGNIPAPIQSLKN